MPPKTPDFWYDETKSGSLTEKILTPISYLYNFLSKRSRKNKKPQRVNIPVICVGNIVAGGSGKTPSVIALYDLIKANNLAKEPTFLTRGYGGCITGPELVQQVQDDVKRTGDEAQILLKHGKTIISANRFKGASLAQFLGSDLILMDDGFQNTALHKDISFLVIDGKTGFGNEKILPAGPLREPIKDAFARAQAVILVGKDECKIRGKIPASLPIFNVDITSLFQGNKNQSYYGFAGLGNPWKFKKTLIDNQIILKGFVGYADHHPYSDIEIENLLQTARKENAQLITTEKDYERISTQYKNQISVFPISYRWLEEDQLVQFLRNSLRFTGKGH